MVRTTEFKIENDIPLPVNETRGKYPFNKMEAGQSFFVKKSEARGAQSSSYNYASRNKGIRFKTRTVDGGIRIWRTE